MQLTITVVSQPENTQPFSVNGEVFEFDNGDTNVLHEHPTVPIGDDINGTASNIAFKINSDGINGVTATVEDNIVTLFMPNLTAESRIPALEVGELTW